MKSTYQKQNSLFECTFNSKDKYIYVKCSVYKFNGMTSLKIYVSVYKYTNLPTVSDLSNVRVYVIRLCASVKTPHVCVIIPQYLFEKKDYGLKKKKTIL